MAKAAKKKSVSPKASPKRKGAGRTLINIKRAYDPPSAGDGMRILIDRLWPRGVTKAKLKLDTWVKDLSPSNELRQWYQHDPEKFAEFRRRYIAELRPHDEALAALRRSTKGRTVTLVTATKELDLSHAIVMRELLR
jgi:uncharacterized protein YeaO (DUF488 family)